MPLVIGDEHTTLLTARQRKQHAFANDFETRPISNPSCLALSDRRSSARCQAPADGAIVDIAFPASIDEGRAETTGTSSWLQGRRFAAAPIMTAAPAIASVAPNTSDSVGRCPSTTQSQTRDAAI